MVEENYDIYDVDDDLGPETDVLVKSAEFALDSASQYPDTLRLILTCRSSINGIASDKDREVRISFGESYEAVDGVARRKDGKNAQFHPNGMIGKWIKSLVKNVGKDKIKGYLGDPRVAENWVGKSFHLKPFPTGKSRDDGTPYYNVLPVGLGEDAQAETEVKSDVDGDVKDQLITLAKDSASHDEFMMAALELSEVRGNSAAEKLVADDSKDGFYAAVKATVSA